MCTGDNIRTAISVARECGMVGHHTKVYMPAYIQNEAEEDQSTQSIKDLQWTDVENENEMLDSYSLEVRVRKNNNLLTIILMVLPFFFTADYQK